MIVAFADIVKAKSVLNAGNTNTSQSYLAKSEGLLKSVLNSAPNSGTANAAPNPAPQQGTSPVSQAESEIAKLDPSLTGKSGAGNGTTADGSADAGAQNQPEPPNQPAQKNTFRQIESVYKKVTLARTLLKAGNDSKAKSTLDQIPSSPLRLLKESRD